jgi:CheY-like chemotaxis protein
MNLSYKILWFEDQTDFIDAYIPDLKKFIEDLGFKFINPQIETDSTRTQTINYDEYDLILMDYKLSDGDKGDTIIGKIRELNVYTEIIFYSALKIDELRQSIQKNALDGVYCVSRGEAAFLPKVKDIIRLTLKKVLDLNAMRGIVMATVSDFDKKMIEIIDNYKEYIGDDTYNAFLQKRKAKLLRSLEERTEKIKQTGLSDFYKEWIFDTSHKWRAVLDIIKNNIPDLTQTTAQFDPEIIKIRDRLAHVTEIEDPSGNGKKCLADGDFLFDDEKSRQILLQLKKHENNFDNVLSHIKLKKE